jgi:hypothetical protein
MSLQGRCAERRQFVRTTAANWLKTLNEAKFYESIERCVERPGREIDARERFNVLRQRVAVLGAFSQAGENEGCRT